MNIWPSLCGPSPHTMHMGASLIHKLTSYLAHSLCTHPRPAGERVKSMYHFNQNPISLSIMSTCGSSTIKTCGQAGNFSSVASVLYVNVNQFISSSAFLISFSSSVSVMYFTANPHISTIYFTSASSTYFGLNFLSCGFFSFLFF